MSEFSNVHPSATHPKHLKRYCIPTIIALRGLAYHMTPRLVKVIPAEELAACLIWKICNRAKLLP